MDSDDFYSLVNELCDVLKTRHGLSEFINSSNWARTSDTERELMEKQHKAMVKLTEILMARVRYAVDGTPTRKLPLGDSREC